MKTKSHLKKVVMNKYQIIGLLSLGVIMGLGLGVAKFVDAAKDDTNLPPMLQVVAEKLKLREEEVQEVVNEIREEKRELQEDAFTQAVQESVDTGTTTAEQQSAILAKYNEWKDKRDSLRGTPGREKRDLLKPLRTELDSLLTKSGISTDILPEAGPKNGSN